MSTDSPSATLWVIPFPFSLSPGSGERSHPLEYSGPLLIIIPYSVPRDSPATGSLLPNTTSSFLSLPLTRGPCRSLLLGFPMHLYVLCSLRCLMTYTCACTLTVLWCGHSITLCHSNELEEGAPPVGHMGPVLKHGQCLFKWVLEMSSLNSSCKHSYWCSPSCKQERILGDCGVLAALNKTNVTWSPGSRLFSRVLKPWGLEFNPWDPWR